MNDLKLKVVKEVDWSTKTYNPLTTKTFNDTQSNNFTRTQWLAEVRESIKIQYPAGTLAAHIDQPFIENPILSNAEVINMVNGDTTKVTEILGAIEAKERWIRDLEITSQSLLRDAVEYEASSDPLAVHYVSNGSVNAQHKATN